jgi:hypothetical protein
MIGFAVMEKPTVANMIMTIKEIPVLILIISLSCGYCA